MPWRAPLRKAISGKDYSIEQLKCTDITYPGYLVQYVTAIGVCKNQVAPTLNGVRGIVGYEDSQLRKLEDHDRDTAYTADDIVSVIKGSGYYARMCLMKGYNIGIGAPVAPGEGGLIRDGLSHPIRIDYKATSTGVALEFDDDFAEVGDRLVHVGASTVDSWASTMTGLPIKCKHLATTGGVALYVDHDADPLARLLCVNAGSADAYFATPGGLKILVTDDDDAATNGIALKHDEAFFIGDRLNCTLAGAVDGYLYSEPSEIVAPDCFGYTMEAINASAAAAWGWIWVQRL